jgi:hypothetical protein
VRVGARDRLSGGEDLTIRPAPWMWQLA